MNEADEKSRGEQLIEEVKARRRSGQYGMLGLLALTLAVAALFAIPRFTDLSYEEFFMLLYMAGYGCAPLIAWATNAALPSRLGGWRTLIAALLGLGLAVPPLVLTAVHDGEVYLLRLLFGTLLLFWGPQVLCIALVRYFIFRKQGARENA